MNIKVFAVVKDQVEFIALRKFGNNTIRKLKTFKTRRIAFLSRYEGVYRFDDMT